MKKPLIVALDPGVSNTIAETFTKNNWNGVLRIELTSTGCCDASLGLRVDKIREFDIVQKNEGLTFVINKQTYELVGTVRISLRGSNEFVLIPEKPVSEWDGFGSCSIRK